MTDGVVCTTEGVGAATSRANTWRASAVVGAFLLLSIWTYALPVVATNPKNTSTMISPRPR